MSDILNMQQGGEDGGHPGVSGPIREQLNVPRSGRARSRPENM